MHDILPSHGQFAVTPHDTNPLASQARGIYVGVAGDVKITGIDGVACTFTNLAAGIVHPISAYIIWSTGTTATGIVALI
jgi:hypothetical protein